MERPKNSPARAVVIAAAWIVLGFLIAPMFVTLPISLTPERFLSIPEGEYSLRHYRTLIEDEIWLSAIIDSIIVGVGTTVVAVVLGTLAAIGLWQLGGPTARIVSVLPMLPLIVPPVVTALALSRAWVWLRMLDTYPALIVSHAILALPFVFMTVSAALDGLDPRIAQAARSLGAGPFRAVFGIVVPNVRVGIMTGALFAFFVSWDEIVVTLFVTSRNVYTLPRKIWSDLRDNIDPAIAAISSLMILVTIFVAMIYLLNRLRRQKVAKQ